MKYTPGPWKWKQTRGNNRFEHTVYTHFQTIAELDGDDAENIKANAKLIAQSPKLLEALQGLFEHCSMIHKFWGKNSNSKEADAAIKAAKKAIKEATE